MADYDGPEPPRRDTRNHMLFEVATEVANRGEHALDTDGKSNAMQYQLMVPDSRWNLLRPQVKGTRDDGRVW